MLDPETYVRYAEEKIDLAERSTKPYALVLATMAAAYATLASVAIELRNGR